MYHVLKYRRLLLVAGVACALILLWLFNPAEAGFFPVCPFYYFTGWQCPGCGSQRALHQLLHLQFAKAWHYNPLLVTSLPYILLGFVPNRNIPGAAGKWRRLLFGVPAICIVLIIIISFWVLRNVL